MRTITIILCACVFSISFGCTHSKNEKGHIEINKRFEAPIFHKSHQPKKQNLPFSDAVQVVNTFYLSGQIGMNHSTRQLVEGGIKAETTQALENIREVLSVHGLHFTDVVKVTVILENMENFSAFNEVYTSYFPQKPARTTFAAKGLAKGAKIEIEVIAVKSVSSQLIHG